MGPTQVIQKTLPILRSVTLYLQSPFAMQYSIFIGSRDQRAYNFFFGGGSIFLSTRLYIPIVCSSVLLNSIPQYGYTMVFNNSSMEGLLSCSQFWTIINIDAVKVLVMTSCNTHFFSFFCGKCPGVQ